MFDFAFVGGGGYDAGYAFVLKGPDAGNAYSYDTYNSIWGAHAEASVNVGFCYYTGNDDELNFVEAFGGKGGSFEGDYFGGISLGWGDTDDNKNNLFILGYGYGGSIGGALNLGYTNVKQMW